MKTKLFMTLAIVLMSVCTSLQAGQPDNDKKDRVFPNEKMIKELNLSDKQIANLQKADNELKAKMQSFRDQKKAFKKEMKGEMSKMKDDRREILKNNLSKDQYIAYLELQVDRLQKMNFKNGRPHGQRPQFGPQRHQGNPQRHQDNANRENIPEPSK
ncbi:hypothetical protein [uncultured Bacteroides sp.]|uniref:hypothetical protein n=1 Tax=uncultured Bacteroides sp. TaxID=162156 RepID=UPI002AABE646|nr:hypothetical protein [uncultured Bacteroides sp.]